MPAFGRPNGLAGLAGRANHLTNVDAEAFGEPSNLAGLAGNHLTNVDAAFGEPSNSPASRILCQPPHVSPSARPASRARAGCEIGRP